MLWSPHLPPPRPTAASAGLPRKTADTLSEQHHTFMSGVTPFGVSRPPAPPARPAHRRRRRQRCPARRDRPRPPPERDDFREQRPARRDRPPLRSRGRANAPTQSDQWDEASAPAHGGGASRTAPTHPRPRGHTPPTRTIRPHPGSPPPPRTTWASRHTPDHPDRAGRSRSRGRRPSPPSSNKTPHQMGTASCMTRSSGSGARSSIRPSTPHPTTSSGLMSPRTHWSAQRAKICSLKGRAL